MLPHPEWALFAQAQLRYARDEIDVARQLLKQLENTADSAMRDQVRQLAFEWALADARFDDAQRLAGGDALALGRLQARMKVQDNKPVLQACVPTCEGFATVVGMATLKQEAKLRIIEPFRKPDLFKKYGQRAGGGLLLFGPPGCGKTHFARALASECQARFFDVSIAQLVDRWFGETEQRLARVFAEARAARPALLFFDEIDALARARDGRSDLWNSIVNTFLHELDGVATNNEGLLVIGASNAPWLIDAAFKRPGRLDRALFVPPPDLEARVALLMLALKDKPHEEIKPLLIAERLEHASGADLMALVDDAARLVLDEVLRTGQERPIRQSDLLAASERRRPSTISWLEQARNHIEFANESGDWDAVAGYLQTPKRKRWWQA